MARLTAALLPAPAGTANELHLIEVADCTRPPGGECPGQQCCLRPGIGGVLHNMDSIHSCCNASSG
eukprot:13687190-Alexandrium_andersonii.AAC.1